jgi:hypothetical protein
MVVIAKTSNKLIRIGEFHIDYVGHPHRQPHSKRYFDIIYLEFRQEKSFPDEKDFSVYSAISVVINLGGTIVIRFVDLCRELGLPTARVKYWTEVGKVPACAKWGNQRIWTPEQAEVVRQFAATHRLWQHD